jgi:tyrosyl-tRNA synthetase
MLEYSKEIIFRAFDEFVIERDSRFGGGVTYNTYPDLETAYLNGELHPSDFKRGVGVHLDLLIEPIRKHFESGRPAKLLEEIKTFEITR